MKQITFLRWLPIAVICLLLCNCQQMSEEPSSNTEGTLNIRTRSAGNGELVYPIHIYAFSEKGSYVTSQLIEDADEAVKLPLPSGSYRIVAIAGTSDEYTIPDKPSLKDVITLDSPTGASTPLMTGKADVTLTSEADATLEITLTHAVSALQLALKSLPSNVASVTVCFSPFYTTLSLDGTYGGGGQTLEIPCTLGTDNVWSSEERYIFPGSTTETVLSIRVTEKDGTETTYGYICQSVPKANQPFHITGNYSDGITVSGSFNIQDWDTAIEIEFDFGAVEQQPDDDEDTEEPDLSSLPEMGSIWNGTIVADIGEADDTGADVLLMSLEEWEATVSQVDGVISSYSVNGITDWRLPTSEEAKTLRSSYSGNNREALNERIAAYDDTLVGIDGEERYLCDKDGTYYSFIFAGGTSITKAGTKRSYYLRLVKTYRMTY